MALTSSARALEVGRPPVRVAGGVEAAGDPAQIRVGIIYPSDPAGTIPGGIETFIRGIIQWAPDDFEFEVVGVTTDPGKRPVGQWTDVSLGRGSYRCLPLFAINQPGRQSRMPATLQYMLRLIPRLSALRDRYHVLDFHRIEPVALFAGNAVPKNAFFHQNMHVLRDKNSDIRWKYLPGAYFRIEQALMRRLSSVYAVRSDAVEDFRQRYPDMKDKFRFTPTWYDPEAFSPVDPQVKQQLRNELLAPHGVGSDDPVFISVGRLDMQKDPLYMLEAFASLRADRPTAKLVMIGDGVLRAQAEERAKANDLAGAVVFAGLVRPERVADYLRAADAFVLSSVYEGMPMCVLEALGCGLPVATTPVGEVGLVVRDAESGFITTKREAGELAAAMANSLDCKTISRKSCLAAASPYVPAQVLAPVFDNYRAIAGSAIGTKAGA